MKKIKFINFIALIFGMLLVIVCFSGCKKTENPIKFAVGTFPDTLTNLEAINSAFDDYNVDLVYELQGTSQIIFSSNRKSSGGQFDLEQASLSFVFDQTNGAFEISAVITNSAFLSKLIDKAKTPGNDLGPITLYSPLDGFEYLLLSSAHSTGNLDLFYLKNRPISGPTLPDVEGPFPVKLFNTDADDAYLFLDQNIDTIDKTYPAYFTSNRNGNFDIFVSKRPATKEIASWFGLNFSASAKVDSINTSSDEKCPYIYKKVMVFTSNRPGGFGGYDLYYSVFRNGKWSSPINFGPIINTSSDEYRPVIGNNSSFSNQYLMFSSNRSGGKGGFDLYFTGITMPK